MMLWGINVSAIKVLVENVDPILLTSFRILLAGVSVLMICRMMNIFRLPSKKEILMIIYISLFNTILHHSFVALGLQNTTGVNTGLIQGTNPLVTMMLSVLLLKHQLTIVKVLGFILGFIGVFITTYSGLDSLTEYSIGDLYIFLGVLVQAYSFILISKNKLDFDPRLLTGYMLVFGSIFIFISSILVGENVSGITNLFNWKLGSIFVFSAIVCTAFGHMVYNYSVKNVGPAETTIFVNLNTFFTLAAAAVFLGESILLNHLIGLIFIIVGVFLGTGSLEYILREKRKKQLNI